MINCYKCIKQFASSFIIFITISLFNSNVDYVFNIASWIAATVTLLYHAIQEPCINCINYNLFGLNIGKFQGSYNANWKNSSKLLNIIYHIDRTCVCFISLYTGIYHIQCPLWIIISICCLGGLGHINNTIIIVGFSFIMSIYRAVLLIYINTLPLYELLIFTTGSILGSIIILFSPNERWITPLRFIWHICCAIVFRFGGLINN